MYKMVKEFNSDKPLHLVVQDWQDLMYDMYEIIRIQNNGEGQIKTSACKKFSLGIAHNSFFPNQFLSFTQTEKGVVVSVGLRLPKFVSILMIVFLVLSLLIFLLFLFVEGISYITFIPILISVLVGCASYVSFYFLTKRITERLIAELAWKRNLRIALGTNRRNRK